ncbi:MAG: autotransporter-associated beta strand repeat-containing protein [Luteolibacter sp.]|uniref:beta strand repeat-containing protein n=1 Tax=Luteolibacter sp. TaxID=1962973 RepID=UPI003266C008
MKPKGQSRLLASTTALIVATFATSSSFAASATWNGTTSATWATDTNWSATPAPGAADTATFNNAGNANTTLDLGAGVAISAIVFDTAGTAAYTLGSGAAGSQTLTLANAGSAIVNAAVATNQLVNANVNLSTVANATNTLTNNSASLLTVAGSINAVPPAGNSLLTVSGSGNTTVTGVLNETGAGSSALLKTGAGTLTLSNGGTYTGTGALGRIPATAAGFPLVAREGTLLLNGGTHTVTGELVIGGVVADGGAGQNAKIQVDAGTLAISSWLSVGRGNGVGAVSSDLVANNAAIITAANFSAGFNGGGATNLPKGSITLNGTSGITVANTVNIAESASSNFTLELNGTSTFKQTANANQTRVGMADGAIGTIHINGGVATFERDFVLGYAGTGIGRLNLDSGSLNVATATERWLKLNETQGSKGELTINGGNVNLNTNTDIRFSTNANGAGTSFVTLNAGAITGYTGNNNGVISLGSVIDLNQASTTGTVNNTFNLNGGTLTIGQIITTNNTGTATFNFNGGTLKAAGNTTNFVDLGGATQKANVKNGGAIIDSNGFNVTVVDPLLSDGSGGLTKQGTGTLTLSGTNTYTGATLVSGGTLTLANGGSVDTSSSVTINGSGAKLVQASFVPVASPVTLTSGSLDGTGTINSLTIASALANTITTGNGAAAISPLSVGALTFQGAATLNLQANGTYMERYLHSTNLVTPATGTVINVTNVSGAWTSGTDYPLVEFDSYASADASHFTLGAIPGLNPNQTATLVNTGTSIALSITGESLVWTGNVNSNWTTVAVGGAKNWSYLGNGIEFSTNSPVVFDDTAANFTVNLAQNVSPSSVVFNNNPNDYTLSSTGGFGISSGSIIKNGDGKVTITTANTYTGATIINAGILEIGGTGSIASSSTITNNSSLILNLSGASNVYANPILGTGSVEKSGAGSLTLSGANTFSGDFTLNAGQLNLNSVGALGTAPGTIIINGGLIDNTSGGAIVMTAAKPQTWNTDISFVGSNTLYMSNGGVTIPASRTVNVQAGTFGVGAITDFGSGYDLVKTGTGTLVLNGTAGAFAGNFNIQNGIVGTNQDLFGAAPLGTGILQNAGGVGTKWTFWNGNTAVTSNVLIRNNDGSNTRQLGIVKRGTGTLTLTNNSNFATSNLSVDSGSLILNNTGTYGSRNDDGTTVTNFTAIVGNTAGANGILEINGATVSYNNRSNAGTEVYRSTLTIGNNATGAGALKLTTGTLTTDKQLAVAGVGGAFADYTQTGGTTSIGGFLAIGLGASNGVFNLSGGTYTMTAGPVTNGAGAGGVGIMNLSGNAIYNHNSATNNAIWIGEAGTGFLNVSGSAALTLPTNGIELGKNSVATASGTFNLLGGTVTTNYVSKPGALATGVMNFNGGTLSANVASTTFLTGLTNAYVHSGGGTINNGGNAITIGQALLAPTGNGVSASGLTFGGGGYIAAPQVTITGDGTGATAVANIDGGGNLTGITITNPGIGYTTPPTFALVGGGVGNTGSIGGTASLVANASGGMTYSGSGTTTLAGANTYTGNTTVNSGTTLVLADNATLQFAPGANGVSNKLTGSGSATLSGDFTINLTGAAVANGNSWTLVNVTSRTFDSLLFNIPGFIQASDIWTKVDGNNTWTFTEATGALTLQVTTPTGYSGWAATNANGETADGDYDKDGVRNGVEYFMGATGSSFTANPGLQNGTVTWPKDPAFNGSYTVQTSPDLTAWTNAASNVVGNTVQYTPVTNLGKVFVRLVVIPN